MEPNPPGINFTLNARTLCIHMSVRPPAIILRGTPQGEISLEGPDGFFLKVPGKEFPFLTPGSAVLVALTIVKPEFSPNAESIVPLN